MRNQKRIVLIVLIVLMVVLLGGGIFAYTYFFTDVFINEQQGFYKYISQNSQIFEMFKDEHIERYLEKSQTEAYNNNGEISIAFSGDIDEETKPTIDEIQKHKITFNGSVDNANKYAYQELKLMYDANEVIGGALINKNDYYGLKVNDIGLNPYIVFENNNLKQFAKNLGLSDEEIVRIPDKIDIEKMTNNKVFTEKELTEIKDRYLKAIKDSLSEDMFSKNEQDEMEVYTLTINEEKGQNLIIALIDTFKNDNLVLNKLKQFYIEQQGVTEEEAQALIDNLKNSLEDLKSDYIESPENNSNISNEYGIVEEQNNQTSNNLYINVYVSDRKLIKTEVFAENEAKISMSNSKNKISLEISIAEGTLTNPITSIDDQNNDVIYKTVGSISIEKNKTEDGIAYIMEVLEGDNKQLFKSSLTFSGLKEMKNVGATLATDVYVRPNDGLLAQSQNTQNQTKNAMEKESINLALAQLKLKIYQDSYISENEFILNENTLKEALKEQNVVVNISLNEDGTYRVQSNSTQNIYTINSQCEIINTELAQNIENTQAVENEEKVYIVSLNLKQTTIFEAIQQKEVTESNMYIINKKSLENLESLFKTLGERVASKLVNSYKNTKIGLMMIEQQ